MSYDMGWQPETQPKGKPPVEKTKGAETMHRLIDANELRMSIILPRCGAKTIIGDAFQKMIDSAQTVDAIPIDYLRSQVDSGKWEEIITRWKEVDTPTVDTPTVDIEPHWIPCSERLPEDGVYLVYAPEYRGGSSRSKECHDGLLFSVCKNGKWSIEHGYYSRPNCVIAWMPLPKPFKVYKTR